MAMNFQCPFCGLVVDLGTDQFRWVTITDAEGFDGREDATVQNFACHQKCLEERLGDAIPIA